MPSLSTSASEPTDSPRRRAWIRTVVARVARLALTVMALSLFYEWASPWAYPKERPVGLGHGALHGAMMPMALPALLLGRDVPIYSDNNAGRWYKIGYIAGINLCGMLVFGSAFIGKSGGTKNAKPPS